MRRSISTASHANRVFIANLLAMPLRVDMANARGPAGACRHAVRFRRLAMAADGYAAKLADGAFVAVARTPAALAEDCKRAALVVTAREAPPGCSAMVIDRAASRAGGAMAIVA